MNLLAVMFLANSVFTVRADGSGDFQDVQTALDHVPAGSTLLIQDSFCLDAPLEVHKEVKMVGDASLAPSLCLGDTGDTEAHQEIPAGLVDYQLSQRGNEHVPFGAVLAQIIDLDLIGH